MRIFVTGGSSYLGQHLVPLAAERHAVCYSFYSRDPLSHLNNGPLSVAARQLDIREATAVERCVSAYRPDVIIHLAGSNRTPAMESVIVDGARAIQSAAGKVGARLVHVSTDVVFNGRSAPYDETAPPDPLHAYGRAKAAAEAIVGRYPNHVIIRTSLIYGLEIMDRSTEWISQALKAGQDVTLFTNQIRNPIWAQTLSRACLELATLNYRGVLNVAGSQAMDRATFGFKMLAWWRIPGRETLAAAPCPPDSPWPLDTRLNTARAAALLSTPLLGVDEVLTSHTGQHYD